MQKNIWMYWETRKGDKKPAYLDICYQTILKNRGEYRLNLLDEKSVGNYIKLPRFIRKIEHIAHKSDYIRFELLRQYGGVWLDSDMILLDDIGKLIGQEKVKHGFCVAERKKGCPQIGFIYSDRMGAVVTEQVYKMKKLLYMKQVRSLFQKNLNIEWTEIGFDILWPILQRNSYDVVPYQLVEPIHWSDYRVLLDTSKDISELGLDKCILVTLYNNFLVKDLASLSSSQILNSDMLISKLFRKALGIL